MGSWFATALGVAGVLVPKCPLCLAAYLCLFGVSAGSAQAIVKLGAPLCLSLIVVSALGTALFVAQRGRRDSTRSVVPTVGGGMSKGAPMKCCGGESAAPEAEARKLRERR
jgi:hypothetical protein